MEGDEAARRLLRALEQLIYDKGRNLSQVSDALGLDRGSLRHSFRGGRLTVDRLFEVLAVLEVRPSRFFAELFPATAPQSDGEDLAGRVALLESYIRAWAGIQEGVQIPSDPERVVDRLRQFDQRDRHRTKKKKAG